jgi:hypothetical protein
MRELYHFEPNAESLKLLIALKEKNLPFESRYVDLLDLEHHRDAFKDASGGGRVPPGRRRRGVFRFPAHPGIPGRGL